MGRPRALVAVVAGAFLLAGCGSGPSQVNTAAIVDGQRTTIDQVQNLLDRAVQEQPYARQLAAKHKLDLVGREIVRQQVLHAVLAKAAKKEGVAADQGAITEALQHDPLAGPVPASVSQDETAGVTQLVWRLRDHREAVTDQYLEQALAVKTLPTLSVNFDYTSIGAPTSESQAPTVDAKTARSEAFAKAEEYAKNPNAIRAELQAGAQGNVGQQAPALSSPEDAATVLFGVPANTAIAFQPNPSSAPTWWVAAVVRQRTTDKQVATDQVQQPTSGQLSAIGVRMLQPYLGEVQYKINPRYGVWDSVGMNLAPSSAELAGVVAPVHGGAPAQQ
ncbi:hypothetical protein [Amycolatopsis ultiminotia]